MAKPETKRALQAWLDFTELCHMLFSGGENCPYMINDLKRGKWCKMAKELAQEMEIDWKKMDMSQSNAIMLAMLEDSYQKIRQDCEKTYIVEFNVKEKPKPEPAAEPEQAENVEAETEKQENESGGE